jgi:ABC-type microcin C transport system duplicated ATPase subunit YejF
MTALSLPQPVPEPASYIASGHILFEGPDLLDLTWEQIREMCGRDIGMILQEPMTSLNPMWTVRQQVVEVLEVLDTAHRREARRRAEALLDQVKAPDPART